MARNSLTLATALATLALIALAGCSSSDSNPATPNPTTPVTFSDYAAAVAAVAPAEFTRLSSPGKATSGNYGVWTTGDYPLLGKAIGNAASDEPMSLYRNLNTLQWTVAVIEAVMAQGEGTVEATSPEGDTVSGDLVIRDLTAPVAIPAECRGALGIDELDLQQSCRLVVGDSMLAVAFGYAKTETRETILSWTREGDEATDLFYATKDLVTGAVTIRGAFHKVTTAETASWIYAIGTAGADNTEFTYNMAWYSSGMGQDPGLGCVQGSGDKDVRFGLRYHQYRAPWTRGQYDPTGPFEQLFGPVGDDQYADLNVDGAYPAEHAGLIDEDGMFVYGDMPHAKFASPFGD